MQRLAANEDRHARAGVDQSQQPTSFPYPHQHVGQGPNPMHNMPQSYPIHSLQPSGGYPPQHNTRPSHQPPNLTPSSQRQEKRSSVSSQATADNQPSWAELKTKAGKDRKRLPLACIACRRKKIRCSGEKPACKHCLKSRTPCVYKVSTRKAGPRTDYMGMLDKRLKRMEERVIKIIPKHEYQSLPDVSRAQVRPNAAQSQAQSSQSKQGDTRKRTAEEAFDQQPSNLDLWPGNKAAAAQENPQPSLFPQPRASGFDEGNLLSEGRDKLPPLEIQEHLAETYFEYVYGQSYHLLHKPSFMRKLSAGALPPVLILAVCAISARFSDHPKLKCNPPFLRGEEWSDAAREIAQRRFDYPNLTILIVYLLLGLHEFGTCQGGRSWMLGGMAHRMAYALQLHKDPPYDPCGAREQVLSFTDREIRRRAMWACFMMDRFNSSGTVRPMMASEDSLDLQLPVKEEHFAQEIAGETETLKPSEEVDPRLRDNMGVAAYMIRVIALWGRVVQYLNLGGREKDPLPAWEEQSEFQQLLAYADDFEKTLPEKLQYSDDNVKIHQSMGQANQFLYLHMVLHQCRLFLNRYVLPATKQVEPTEQEQRFSQDSHAKALQAAEAVSILLENAWPLKLVAPFAGFCAYMSSAVQLHAAFSRHKDTSARARKNLKINVGYLNRIRDYWGNFYFLSATLRDTYRKYHDRANKPGTTTPDARIEDPQYGDWYDRYPHGVSRTEFEEPVTNVKREAGEDAALGEKEDLQSVDSFITTLSPDSQAKGKKASDKRHNSAASGKRSRRETMTNNKPGSRKNSNQASMPTNLQLPAATPLLRFDSMDMREPSTGFPESYDRSPVVAQQQQQQQQPHHDLSATQGVPPQMTNQQANAFPLDQMPSSYYMPQQDLAAAYANFGGLDPTGGNLQDLPSGFWPSDYSQVNENFWSEPHTAWFPPFNVNPPDYQSSNDSYMAEPQMLMGQQDPGMPPNTGHGDDQQGTMANMNMLGQGDNTPAG